VLTAALSYPPFAPLQPGQYPHPPSRFCTPLLVLSPEYRSRNFRDTSSAAEYDEYEGADDFDEAPRRTTSASTSRSGGGASSSRPQPPPKSAAPKEKPVEKPKEVNLFDFGDEDEAAAPAPATGFAAPAAPILGGDGE
jgi:epsin